MSRRSPWAMLGILGLVGSLVAVPAGPVAGKDGEADHLAKYSACVGLATEPARFRDVPSGSVSEDAINCVVHYGIMLETSQRRFLPSLGVTRRQMALFLIRAAGPAGIEVPEAEDQGFRDIDHLPREPRDAINQLVDLRIARGLTRSSFSPDTVVTRRQMVQFLARFLELAPVGEGGFDIHDVEPDDEHFDDLDDLDYEPYDAVRALFELGVTNGTSVTTFSPDKPVTRAQMALFISRMLDHTNARPAGVTIQAEMTSLTAADTVDMVVSVRDEDYLPVDEALVDLFYAPVDDNAFGSGGKCSRAVVAEAGDQGCVIDSSDEFTNRDGNLIYTMVVDESLVLWAWSGDRGDRFDLDVTDYGSVELGASDVAVAFLVTYDLHPKALAVPFGRTVEFTFQLVDEDDNPVPRESIEIRIWGREKNDRREVRDRARTYETDSDGRVELSFRLTDPDPDDDDVDGTLDLSVVDSDGLDVIDETGLGVVDGALLRWSDNDEVASALVLEQPVVFHRATESGGGPRNRVTATLVDQYGDPIRGGVRVHFVSNDDDGLGRGGSSSARSAYRRTTNSRGTATVTYQRDSSEPGIETIDAFTEGKVSLDAESIDHYWVDDTPAGTTLTGEVAYHDDDSNTVVLKIMNGGPYLIFYDTNDQFNVVKRVCPADRLNDGRCPVTADRITVRENYADFRRGLDKRDSLQVVVGDDRNRVNGFTRNV